MHGRTTRCGFVHPPRLAAIAAIAALCCCAALARAGTALASVSITATEEVTEGTLQFINSTPANVTFPVTGLTGKNLTVTKTQPFDVGDARGTGAGWNVTATSTVFKNGTHTLAATATTVGSAPTVECDAEATCTKATSGVTYPYTLPAGETMPTATKLFDAAETTGMGDQTVTPTWSLAVPANAYHGTYTATWEFTLATGP
jgi:hypothetical protein